MGLQSRVGRLENKSRISTDDEFAHFLTDDELRVGLWTSLCKLKGTVTSAETRLFQTNPDEAFMRISRWLLMRWGQKDWELKEGISRLLRSLEDQQLIMKWQRDILAARPVR